MEEHNFRGQTKQQEKGFKIRSQEGQEVMESGETQPAMVGGRWSKKRGVRRRRRRKIRDTDRQCVEKRRSNGVLEEEEE